MNNFFITFAFLFFLPLERESVEIVQNKKLDRYCRRAFTIHYDERLFLAL